MPRKRYDQKRDFELTPEPAGGEMLPGQGPLRFCVTKHAARRLHYDLRMEAGGTLLCWAVPQGPSLNTADKRLAVHVEDHPLEYLEFEGVIPKGQYGGGEMILWDEGIYSPDEEGLFFDNRAECERQMREGFAAGKLSFTMRGHKLNGSWTLVKTKRGEEEWLLIKHQDEYSSTTRDILKEDRSVRSGLTVEDLREGRTALQDADLQNVPGIVRAAMPRTFAPMLCTEADAPFDDDAWMYEVKLDGIRAIAIVEDRTPRIFSRNGNDITAKFPALARELAAFPHRNFLLDGEIVLYDAKGVPTFQGLLERFQLNGARDIERQDQLNPIEYCIFDVLFLDGWDLRNCALGDRRKVLEDYAFRGARMRLLDAFPGVGTLLFEQARRMGFEGIVAKKLDSKYRDGRRSESWIKFKDSFMDDFLVVGWIEGEGARNGRFGSLILGAYEGGKLEWQGNVGGGFSDDQLVAYRQKLDAMKPGPNPFGHKIDANGKIHWVEPETWVEVRYGARTREGRLRFPVFVRERSDIPILSPAPNVSEKVTVNDRDDILEQLDGAKKDNEIVIDGHRINFSNLDRVFWPATETTEAVTKRDLARYYVKIAAHLLPQLKDRPLSLVRCPDGIGGEHFFQKHWEKGVPDFVDRVPIWSGHNDKVVTYTMCNNLATLVWMAQMAVLEIHPWYSRYATGPEGLPLDTSGEDPMDASALSYPDFLVVDLDPNIPKEFETDPSIVREGFRMSVEVTLRFKTILDELQLTGFLKTSGKTGIHVFIPIQRNLTYGVVRLLAETLGKHLEKLMPDKVTMEWVVKKRPEKVFFDHNQNVRGKTLASIFSPRPVAGAPISFPLEWARLKTVTPEMFNTATGPGSLVSYGDPWEHLFDHPQDLTRFAG